MLGPLTIATLLLLAQSPSSRVEASDTNGRAFWGTGLPGAHQWEQVTGHVQLEVRTGGDSPPTGSLSLELVRDAETWSVELAQVSPPGVAIDVDLPGPGGAVHAAAVLSGQAKVSRGGNTLPGLGAATVTVLTTGFHADDGSFETLPGGRSGDLEILISVQGVPGIEARGGALDIGFDDVDVRVDGIPVQSSPFVDATAGVWPGAAMSTGLGGSGLAGAALVYGPATTLSPVQSVSGGPAPPPANTAPATMLPQTPAPANTAPATMLPGSPTPANTTPATPLPSAPPPLNSAPATPLPATPAPGNAAPALPLLSSPAPGNSAPAGAPSR